MKLSTPTFLLSFLTLVLCASVQAATVITGAVFDPDDPDDAITASYGALDLTGTHTVEFDTSDGTLIIDGTSTSSGFLVNDGNSSPYYAFLFDSINIGSGVTITVTTANPNAAPVNGLAILSLADFTLDSALTFGDATTGQGNPGGNLSLVAEGDLTISSTVQSNGGDGKGNPGHGANAGLVTIAAGGTLDINGASLLSTGGNGRAGKNADGGDGAVINLFSDNIVGTPTLIDTSAGTPSGSGAAGTAGSFDDTFGGFEYVGVAVPEPSSSALLIGASSLLLLRRKRAC